MLKISASSSSSSVQKPFYRWVVVAAVVLGLILLWLGVKHYLTLEQVKQISRATAALAQSHPELVFAGLALMHLIGMAFSLPTKAVLTVLSGALLGAVWGAGATLLGTLAGTTILFVAARHFLRQWVKARLGPKAEEIHQRLVGHPIRTVIGLRLMITLPYGPITLASAVSDMTYPSFLVGSLIGDLPVIVLYAMAGERLFSLAATSDALSPTTIVILLGAGMVFFIGALWGRKGESKILGG